MEEEESDYEDQEVADVEFVDFEFDNHNHQNANNLNILDLEKPPVFPQQKSLACNIFRRIEYVMKTGGQNFENYERLDFQVRKYELCSMHSTYYHKCILQTLTCHQFLSYTYSDLYCKQEHLGESNCK